jgi:hypothetical protein
MIGLSMSLIRNEQTKLLATALNNTAVATVATAIIAPMAAFLYGSNALVSSWWPLPEAVPWVDPIHKA